MCALSAIATASASPAGPNPRQSRSSGEEDVIKSWNRGGKRAAGNGRRTLSRGAWGCPMGSETKGEEGRTEARAVKVSGGKEVGGPRREIAGHPSGPAEPPGCAHKRPTTLRSCGINLAATAAAFQLRCNSAACFSQSLAAIALFRRQVSVCAHSNATLSCRGLSESES